MKTTPKNILLVVVGTGAYGLALGCWRSPLMAGFLAIKLPLIFLATTAVVSVFNWMTASLFGLRMTFREVWGHMFSAMSVAANVLLALTPVALFLIFSGAPFSGSRAALRFTHACILLLHMAVLAGAGLVGNLRLYANLKACDPAHRATLRLLVCWLAAFAIAGCQIGWMMRPLVGSPNILVEFLRADALDGNFLESLFSQVIPHFIHKGILP